MLPLMQADHASPAAESRALELVLADTDGAEWTLSLTPGMERFVGRYSRLAGFGPEHGLLVFRAVSPA